MPTITIAPLALPEPSTVEAVYKALEGAHDAVERVVWQVEKVADEVEVANVAPVTLERIGVVASVLADLDMHIEEMTGLRERIAKQLFSLGAIRSEQNRRATEASADNG